MPCRINMHIKKIILQIIFIRLFRMCFLAPQSNAFGEGLQSFSQCFNYLLLKERNMPQNSYKYSTLTECGKSKISIKENESLGKCPNDLLNGKIAIYRFYWTWKKLPWLLLYCYCWRRISIAGVMLGVYKTCIIYTSDDHFCVYYKFLLSLVLFSWKAI